MDFDRDQQAAIDAKHNVVVRAGAGAGKTRVLAERFIRLVVHDHVPVDRILTLTFTRKAAAEMHERIYRALATHTAQASDPFVVEQLERFDSAVISTLDSFCAAVARSGSTAFGVSPNFTVDENRVARFSDDLALGFLLGKAEEARTLVRLNRFGPLWHDGFAGLARDHFLVSRELDLQDMVRLQRHHLVDELDRLCGELAAAAAAITRLDGNAARCIETGQATLAGARIDPLVSGAIVAELRNARHDADPGVVWDGGFGEELAALAAVSGIRKTCGSSRKPEVAEFKGLVDDIKGAAEGLRELLLTLASWAEITRATDLASQFQSVVIAEKRRTGVLSYRDVTALALAVLEHNVELRRYYKRRFAAVMIDEFQDNNDEQKQLLYLLAERVDRDAPGIPGPADLDPGKLFFVGDEKQSIYGFRGADVSVFRRLSDELGGSESAITLASNYRSEPGLISFFNAFFGRVFSDPEPDYEARFAPLQPRAPTPGLTPTVQLWRIQPREDNSAMMENDEAEAFCIARYIRETVDAGALVVADDQKPGHTRPASYADFAILMRSTGNQMRVEQMLRLMGVPYVAQSSRSLFLEAPMNDIYSALQLLLFPQDRIALAAFLRSPLVGMTDAGLVRVLGEDGPLFTPVPGLAAEDDRRYTLARTRLATLRELADSQPITELVHHIWYRWGYRYHLLRREDHAAYLEHYTYIYELARLHEDRGLAGFLRTVRTQVGRMERLDDLTVVRDESDGVNIMTIHKAKGLEFPVVIVANTGNRGRTDRVTDAPFYNSDTQGLVFNVSANQPATPRDQPVNFIYRNERTVAALREVAELRRLLYVAATRAGAHLVFSGYPRGNDKSMMNMLAGPFAAAAQELQGSSEVSVAMRDLAPVPLSARFARQEVSRTRDVGETARDYAAAAESGHVAVRNYPRRTFSATELNAAAIETGAITGTRDAAAAEPEPTVGPLFIDTPAGEGLADVFGTFTHYCVERLGTGEADRARLTYPGALPGSIRPPLEGANLGRFLSEGVELAEAFLSSALWQTAATAESFEFELPFMLNLPIPGDNAVTVRGIMDLVVRTRDKVIVIDFKTDRLLSATEYVVQLALYRRAAAAIFGTQAESVLCHLRSGQVLPVAGPVTDAALEELVGVLREQDGGRPS